MRQHPRELDNDGNGQPVRRGVLVAVDPDPRFAPAGGARGLRVVADDRDPALGIRSVYPVGALRNLCHAPGPSAPALRRARVLQADFDHVYEPAGGDSSLSRERLPLAQGSRGGPADRDRRWRRRFASVDGRRRIEQNGFAGTPAADRPRHCRRFADRRQSGAVPGRRPRRVPLCRRRLWRHPRRRIGQLNRPGPELAGLEAPASDQHQPRRSAKPARPARGAGRSARAESRSSRPSATTAPPRLRNIPPPIPA